VSRCLTTFHGGRKIRNIPFIIGILVLQALIPQNASGQSQRIDPSEDRKCSIGGHVTNILTGAPVKRTTVRLNPAGSEADIFASATMSVLGFGASPGKTQYSVASQADGAFCFEMAEAGQYSLSGTKPGFLNTNYGAKSPMDSGVNVIVGTQPRNDITLALVPQSVISGRITDDEDEPVNGAFVNLLMRVGYAVSFGMSLYGAPGVMIWASFALQMSRQEPTISSSNHERGTRRQIAQAVRSCAPFPLV
jgi:hypothetical protein